MITRLLPFLLILLAVGIFFGYLNPTYTGPVAALTTEIKGYDSALAAADEFNQKESKLAAQKSAIPSDALARLQEYLPDSIDNVQLILDLNSLAARAGVQLGNFEVDGQNTGTPAPGFASVSQNLPLQSGSSIDLYQASMSGSGSYSAFRSFLNAAENSLQPLDLVELNLKDSPTGIYTYQMTFRFYALH